jgi:predicted HD phosphohydrolase
MATPLAKAQSLVTVLEKYGQGDYIGESISQLEHCLQAAHQAQLSGKLHGRFLYSAIFS